MEQEKTLAQQCGYYEIDYTDSQLSYDETKIMKDKREAEMKAELSKRNNKVSSSWM